ncbi:MAG: hypothetical protein V1743_01065 [Nanoarchaeota archaeon]
MARKKLQGIVGTLSSIVLISGLYACSGQGKAGHAAQVQSKPDSVEVAGKKVPATLAKYCKENNIPLETAVAFDTRFWYNPEGNIHFQEFSFLKRLTDAGVPPDSANAYGRFNAWIVDHLWRAGISPTDARAIAKEYTENDLDNISTIAAVYNARKATPRADKYIRAIGIDKSHYIPDLVKQHFTIAMWNEFDNRFDGYTRLDLHAMGIDGKTANKYDREFRDWEVTKLCNSGITPEEANRLNALNKKEGTEISCEDIINFHEKGITYEKVVEHIEDAQLDRMITTE